MRETRAILVVVCIFVIAFGGGAATYAQLSDTETAAVSAAAGQWTPTPVCEEGLRARYVAQQRNFVFRSGQDIIEFSNIERRGNRIISADFTSEKPINTITISDGTNTKMVTFDEPITSGTITAEGLGRNRISEVVFSCGNSGAANAEASSSDGISPSAAETPETATSTATPMETITAAAESTDDMTTTSAATPIETMAEPTSSATKASTSATPSTSNETIPSTAEPA